MSLFIAGFAFSDPDMFRSARLSVMLGSLLSAIGGAAVLWTAGRSRSGSRRKGPEPFP